MRKIREREVTFSCSVTSGGRGYLETNPGDPAGWPQRNHVCYIDQEHGEIQMQGAVPARPLLVTVETGSERQLSAIALRVYDGPMNVLGDGWWFQGDQAGAGERFWFGLDPGLYHVVIQVTGRAEARAREGVDYDQLLLQDDEAEWQVTDADIETIEHWWICFTNKLDGLDEDVELPVKVANPMTMERALWAALPGANATQEALDEAADYLTTRYIDVRHPLAGFVTGPLETIRAEQERRRQGLPPQPQAPRGSRSGDFGIVVDHAGSITGNTGVSIVPLPNRDGSEATRKADGSTP